MPTYSDPALWEHSKAMARQALGGHSARAMQMAGKIYRAAGGRYIGKPTKAQQSLKRWTAQDWGTKSGKPSRETGERYLPRAALEGLTSQEYAATTRAKRKGTAAGQQFVKQPKRIAAKVAALKGNPTMKKPTPAQLAARARFAEMARSGAFKRKAKAKPRKKTVSQKISQLMHEGYPQKQAVAVALSEQRAGKVKRNPVTPSASYDYPLINDVKLFAVNDEMLYRQQGRPIVENLARKMVKGQFDAEKAVKLYGYLADSAVKKYSVDYVGSRAPTLTILSKPERQILAQHLFEFYADEIKDAADEMAESKRKRNPATGRKASRTKLNPATKPTERTVYQVQHSKDGKTWDRWMTVMYLPMAKQIAERLAAERPKEFVRVESFKVLM